MIPHRTPGADNPNSGDAELPLVTGAPAHPEDLPANLSVPAPADASWARKADKPAAATARTPAPGALASPDISPAATAIALLAENPEEPWEPTEATLLQRWSRGWRLASVITAAAALYLTFRGGHDYQALKNWRGRAAAENAAEAMAAGDREEATRLLQKALTLAPRDRGVLLQMAALHEPEQDPTTLLALRQLIAVEAAEPEDIRRLCRLAFAWNRGDLADAATLEAWLALPPAGRDAEQTELAARGLALRGKHGEAAAFLQTTLNSTESGPDSERLRIALGEILLQATLKNAPQTGVGILTALVVDPAVSPDSRRQAASSLARVVAAARGFGAILTPEGIDSTRKAFTELAGSPDTSAEEKATLSLAVAALDYDAAPGERAAIASRLAEKFREADPAIRLETGRWFLQHGLTREVVDWVRAVQPDPVERAWTLLLLDALFALQRWDDLTTTLDSSPTADSLPPAIAALFRLRIAAARSAGKEELEPLLASVLKESARADWQDAMFVANNLEKSISPSVARQIYERLTNHERVSFPARLGVIRCLDKDPTRTADLITALKSLLAISPDSPEARNDLAYLRLLEKQPEPSDAETAAAMAAANPQVLAYRVTAALAALRSGQPQFAANAFDGADVNWNDVRPGWKAVRAAALAVNGDRAYALDLTSGIRRDLLRTGERKLLEDFVDRVPELKLAPLELK